MVKAAALRMAQIIRSTRLSRNMTQTAAAERAKMSAFTWMKIERGDVSVSMGSWFSALECLGLLEALELSPGEPAMSRPGPSRVRARPSAAKTDAYDF